MRDQTKVGLWLLVIVVIVGAAGAAFSAKMESSTYNRLTGAKTTWWDALWVDLRVVDSPKASATGSPSR